jgi:phage gp16-like protein
MTKALIQKIHIAKSQLGLDDETYRATLLQLVAKDSSKAMTEAELQTVLQHFQKAGFKPKGKLFTGPSSKYAAKIHALWISSWNLGVIRDNSDAAMEAFIHRQTGVAKAQWLKDAKDAAKVIDALKAWLSREAGVDWGKQRNDPQIAILNAQWQKLKALGAGEFWAKFDSMRMSNIDEQIMLGKLIREAQEAPSC